MASTGAVADPVTGQDSFINSPAKLRRQFAKKIRRERYRFPKSIQHLTTGQHFTVKILDKLTGISKEAVPPLLAPKDTRLIALEATWIDTEVEDRLALGSEGM